MNFNAKLSKIISNLQKFLIFILLCILLIVLTDRQININNQSIKIIERNINKSSSLSLLYLLKIEWINNTKCEWKFINNKLISKFNINDTIKLLSNNMYLNNISLSFFGDSMFRRIGMTLYYFIKSNGKTAIFKDNVVHDTFNWDINQNNNNNIHIHFKTLWTPKFNDITNKIKQIKINNNNHIIIINIGIHNYRDILFDDDKNIDIKNITQLLEIKNNFIKYN